MDKCIRIWDIEQNEILIELEHGSYKPITAMKIHPVYSDILITCDMDNNIKVWKWKLSKLMKQFKKIHGRVIYQIDAGLINSIKLIKSTRSKV